MRVSVPVMPRLFVPVVTAGRNELVQNGRQVMLKPRLKFNCAQGGRASNVEDVDGAALDSRGTHNFCNLLGKVVHVTVTLSVDENLLLMSHSQVSHPFRNRAATTLTGQDNLNPSAEVMRIRTPACVVGLDWRE